jgi:hypothetical protein
MQQSPGQDKTGADKEKTSFVNIHSMGNLSLDCAVELIRIYSAVIDVNHALPRKNKQAATVIFQAVFCVNLHAFNSH